MSTAKAINELKQAMERDGIQPSGGLGEELFLFASTLMPVVNIDLLVTNDQAEVLLAWRDDAHCGTGWHIPGGCIRFRESIGDRVQKTAVRELGQEVVFDPEVLHAFQIMNEEKRHIADQNERAHFITLVIACRLKEPFDPSTQSNAPGEPGYLRWFSELPEDLLQTQEAYREQWDAIMKKLKEKLQNGYLEERN